MNVKNILDQAISKGESLRDELTKELLKSKVFRDFTRSDIFVKAVSTALKTKNEVSKVLRQNIKTVMHLMDVPSRNDLSGVQKKLDSLEKMVDRVGKKAIAVSSLSKVTTRKITRIKKAATPKKTGMIQKKSALLKPKVVRKKAAKKLVKKSVRKNPIVKKSTTKNSRRIKKIRRR